MPISESVNTTLEKNANTTCVEKQMTVLPCAEAIRNAQMAENRRGKEREKEEEKERKKKRREKKIEKYRRSERRREKKREEEKRR